MTSRRHRRHEGGEGLGAEPGAGRIVRIGQVDQLGPRPDRSPQCNEVVAVLHRVAARQRGRRTKIGACRLRRKGVHREAELGRHHVIAGAGEHLRELHQQFMRAIAQQQARRLDAMERGERPLQVAAERIGIDVDGCPAHRGWLVVPAGSRHRDSRSNPARPAGYRRAVPPRNGGAATPGRARDRRRAVRARQAWRGVRNRPWR